MNSMTHLSYHVMNVQGLTLCCSVSGGVLLHDVDVQVGRGVEHGQQVGDLCHPIYRG